MKTSAINPERRYFKGSLALIEEGQGPKRDRPVKRTPEAVYPPWLGIIIGLLTPFIVLIFVLCPFIGSLLSISGMRGFQESHFYGDHRDQQ